MSDTPTLRRKPYQKKGLTTPQKLMVAGVFLAFVAFAIGGEDRPGIVTMAQKTMEDGTSGSDDVVVQGDGGTPGVQQQESVQDDAELSNWYASSSPDPNPLAGPRDDQDSQSEDDAIDWDNIKSKPALALEGQPGGAPINVGPTN
ncbi:hypothetical protein [Qipengyuania sp. DGS5-3]|uniref:hypothetical protein n=1 Tax=Qipengyuania sp. DGS5-3 TaxID=3349632 RepID=UPI0036D3DBD8